jgi:hypothetical protein
MRIPLIIALLFALGHVHAADLSASDHEKLQEARAANALRFQKEYENSRFSAHGTFDRVTPAGVVPGYMISFDARGVSITCLSQNQTTLAFVEKLNMGDKVEITAKFNAENLMDRGGFLFRSCTLSKPK